MVTYRLVQVSMCGPNVNRKKLQITEEYREHNDADYPVLIKIGSCGLHSLHGAYGIASDWNLDKLLKANIEFSNFHQLKVPES